MTELTKPIWNPSQESIDSSNIMAFIRSVNNKYGLKITTYAELHQWSINSLEEFYQLLWEFSGLIASNKGQQKIEITPELFKSKFFVDTTLNYTENLLAARDADELAIIYWGENKVKRHLTYGQVYQQVAQMATYLKSLGVKKGDRVAGYVPNAPEAVMGMLATASLGAIWSSCSPDFGVGGLLDRFGQIGPKVLIMAEGYDYNGKHFDCQNRISDLLSGLPSIEKIIVFSSSDWNFELLANEKVISWKEALQVQSDVTDIYFEQVAFNDPLVIMYSSGTTGVPKCIVHGVGGTLLEHIKDHQMHTDLKPGDRIFYFTTCGWMMWNWLVSGLASKATICLFDGSPSGTILWEYAEEEKITHFGTSAKYIDLLHKANLHPNEQFDLSSLRMIDSTGSPLMPESYDFVYEHISSDVHLASISGGTDIISCFALGNPIGPVWRGELQAAGLGMDLQVYNEQGQSVIGEKGELVCRTPFPSMPIYFWGDQGDKKYHAAYFEKFPGVWCHGDYVEHTIHDGFIIFGRSDTVLNPGGVRIGTAEIYRQVEKIPEVLESLVIGQDWHDDVRVVLFIVLKPEATMTQELISKIKLEIKTQASPRHVPSKIIQVTDIPKTKSGKIVELAVRDVIHGKPVLNKTALTNPEALDLFANLEELKTE